MAKGYAHRDLKLCSKDCLCLFVCPTGATDNETGQIDKDACIGCGACMRACPAHAITMMPREYPKEQEKKEEVIKALEKVIQNKIKEVAILRVLKEKEEDLNKKKLYQALYHSNKVIIEDLYRESGYMTLSSKRSQEFLAKLLQENTQKAETIQKLLDKTTDSNSLQNV